MPKEQINFPQWRKTLHGLPGLSGSDEGATVEVEDTMFVRWHDGSKVEGWVQLSFAHSTPRPWAEFDGAVAWPSPEVEFSESCYPPLSRGELNRLIRVLRRARDQAYGRDE